ncbi:MAG: hypothetical protein H7Z39_16015 [Burkholderiaceae bacterium]|nr:hypothetical protein [Burkholderiaceae bacterium]
MLRPNHRKMPQSINRKLQTLIAENGGNAPPGGAGITKKFTCEKQLF